MISPTKTPFLSAIDKVDATAVLHEWQTDALAAAASNAHLEGDANSADAATATSRLSNTCQILKKVPRVTGTQEAVKKAGRKSEMAHQVMKRGLELKRDLEYAITQNVAEDAGNATTARKLGGYETWITSNESRGTSGSDGGSGNTQPTDGTQRAFTETLLREVLRECAESGGDPDTIFLGTFNRQAFSGFSGNATRMKTAEDKTLTATIDVYQGEFGDLRVVTDFFIRARGALVVQTDMWALATLRDYQLEDMAKTGDSKAKELLIEATLEARNEASSGIVADLTTS